MAVGIIGNPLKHLVRIPGDCNFEQWRPEIGRDYMAVAVVVKTVLGSHFGW